MNKNNGEQMIYLDKLELEHSIEEIKNSLKMRPISVQSNKISSSKLGYYFLNSQQKQTI